MVAACINLTVLEKDVCPIWLFQMGEAVVIDSMRTIEAYEEFAKEQGAMITNVMDTHYMPIIFLVVVKLAEKVKGKRNCLPLKDAEEVCLSYESLVKEE